MGTVRGGRILKGSPRRGWWGAFEQVEDDSGGTFYQVVDAPGEDDVVELQN